MIDMLDILADDKQIILLRTSWNQRTGGIVSSIVLQQIFYHWNNRGRKPFYKFLQPCAHKKYRRGDSWEEELNISRKEFSTALKTIAFKRTEKTRKQQKPITHSYPVEYWTDGERVTHYTIHEANFRQWLSEIYTRNISAENSDIKPEVNLNPQTGFRSDVTKIPKRDLPLNPQTGFSKIPKRDLALHYTENTIKEYTKTTTPTPPNAPNDEQRGGGGSFSSSHLVAEDLTTSLLAQALDTTPQSIKDIQATRHVPLNELCHAVAYAIKHRGDGKGKIAKPVLWLKNGKDVFDSKGGFLHHNGTRHINIPALQAWFYALTQSQQMTIIHPNPASPPSYMALKKAERWLNTEFLHVVFTAAQSHGKNT